MKTPLITPTAQLPIPGFFDPHKIDQVWRVPYQDRETEAMAWARQHNLTAAATDKTKIALLIVDDQNTFCLPDFELYVGGRSGRGAVDDLQRLIEFIYRNLGRLTAIVPTMDTHLAFQIFHRSFWINDSGEHPAPYTMIKSADVAAGTWRVNPTVAGVLKIGIVDLQRYADHYVRTLEASGKYALTIWPYHGMLGGIGHALVSALEEACFFHSIARGSQVDFQIKGGNALTENYSILRPEVLTGPQGETIAQKNARFIKALLEYDAVIIAGQAKSHCVAWTIDDLLTEIKSVDPKLADKVYLLEDCTSPVVIPGIIDFTDEANRTFQRFASEGMHIVTSTTPLESWPGLGAKLS